MNTGNKFRFSLLALTFSGVIFVLGKSFLYPNVKTRTFTPFTFLATVPLPGWQSLGSSSLIGQDTDNYRYISGRSYRYTQNGLPLEIKMRYLAKTPRAVEPFANLVLWNKEYMNIPLSNKMKPVIAKTEGVGFHGLFVYRGEAYLSACINPDGSSTFTEEQFRRNRYAYDARFDRLFSWLLGRTKLRDERCLWTQMSVPVKNYSPENSYKILEKAWVYWYKSWQPRFPKL